MPALTKEQHKAQIDLILADLARSQKEQATTSGGPGPGSHIQRGDVLALQKRLEYHCKEYERLEALELRNSKNLARFGRPR